MNKWFESLPADLWPIAVSALAIYVAVILCTRLAGKRSFSKMSSFDFAITIAIGSVISSTILLKSVSLMQGLLGLVSLYLLQMIVAFLRRYSWMSFLVENKPYLLMDGPHVLEENLLKARVSLSDLKAKLREANVINRQQVKAVIFEATGDISVLHLQTDHEKVEPWIMDEVNS